MSKTKNDGLDQYGPERFGRLILLYSQKNAGLKGLNSCARGAANIGAPILRNRAGIASNLVAVGRNISSSRNTPMSVKQQLDSTAVSLGSDA